MEPNPAQPGQDVVVIAPGETQVTAHVDGSDEEIVVKLDKNGKGKFKVPSTAEKLILIYSTRMPPKLLAEVAVISSKR